MDDAAPRLLAPELDAYDNVVLDLDGVCWYENDPVRGAPEAVRALLAAGKRIAFVTNTSTSRSVVRDAIAKRLGVDVNVRNIYTSAYAAARLLRESHVKTVFLLGGVGVERELETAGVRVVNPAGDADAKDFAVRSAHDFERLTIREAGVDAVLVGWDLGFDFTKLCAASLYLERGAKLFATNCDAFDVLPRGRFPGAGAMVAAVQAAAPYAGEAVVAGKPSRRLAETIARDLGWDLARTLVVGDRLDTDVMLAVNGGMDSCLVLTGCTTKTEVDSLVAKFRAGLAGRFCAGAGGKEHPVFVRESLAALVGGAVASSSGGSAKADADDVDAVESVESDATATASRPSSGGGSASPRGLGLRDADESRTVSFIKRVRRS